MATLQECKAEMNSIVNELLNIESGVRNDFSGIGQDLCANCISKVADQYRVVLRRLNAVRENVVMEMINESD
ncbi:MAG TPA: hypothetical protein GX717_04715 [Clostridiaceae bacterium]|nr:hypothetical protein [Clostridiaceae bacterium]